MKSIFYKLTLLSIISILTCSSANAQLFGESLDFTTNGNSYVQLSGDNDFGKVSNLQGEFTFEAWVLSEGSKTWSRVFDFGDSTNDFIIFTTKSSNNNECEFSFRTGGGFTHRVHGGVFPEGWTHVACTLTSNGQATIYLDGVEKGTTDWNKSINDIVGTTKNYLGKSLFNHDPYFEGKMDEVRVWKEARTQAEIQDWMNCELTGDNENLIGYFKMNQGLSTGPSTSDNFVNNFGKLSSQDGILYNFSLAGDNGNWINESPMASTELSQNCIEFDDADGIKVTSESNFDYSDAHTFEAWINPNKNDGYRIITTKANSSLTDYPFYMDYNGSTLFWGQRSSTFHNWAAAYNAIDIGKWQHVAGVTYEINGGVKNEIYVNGLLLGEAFHPNQQLTQNNSPVTIGWVEQNFRFNGKMSNIRYWNKRKNPSELIKNMSTQYASDTEGLVAQFNTFDHIESSLIDNAGGNATTNIRTPDFSNDPCFVRFIQQPEDKVLSITGGDMITFAAQVEECNAQNINSYQWQKDGVDITGAVNQSYTINTATISDLGDYTLVVTTCGNTYISRKARLSSLNPGTQLNFDGNDDYMTFTETVSGESAYTIETWVRFNTPPTNQNIIVLSNSEGPESFFTNQIRVNPDGYAEHSIFDVGSGTNTRTVSHPEKLIANKWYHIRATAVEGGNISISINGVISDDTSPCINFADGDIYYVGHPACGHSWLDGDIDEIRIWSIDTDTYNDPELLSEPANLKHYFNFNKGVANADNSGLTSDLLDPFSAPSNTATLSNFNFNGAESNWITCGPFEANELENSLSNVARFIGEEAILGVYPSGLTGDETYQWYKDGEAIPNATSNQLSFADLKPSDAGNYNVIMQRPNDCPAVSNESNVIVYGSGEVLNFDGVDDYVTIDVDDYADDPFLNDYQRTISLWVKLEGDVGLQNILQATDASGPMSTVTNQIYTDADGYLSYYGSPTGTLDGIQFKSDFQFEANNWHHISLIMETNNGLFEFYVDGVLLPGAFPSTVAWSGVTQYYIGSKGISIVDGVTTVLNPLQGEIDELKIFHRKLLPQEIDDTKNFEWYSQEAMNCACQYADPKHYIKFNQGLADSDNTNPSITNIPDFMSSTEYRFNTVKMHNFDLEGPESNWSDCSPIKVPEVFAFYATDFPYAGQDVSFSTQANTDTSLLTYQWRKDSVNILGATTTNLILPNFTFQDSGYYDVIVSDFCDPKFIDTLGILSPTPNCFDDFLTEDIDYPNQTIYTGCTDQTDENCGDDAFYITSGYCDTDNVYEGKESVFKLTLAESQVISLSLTDFDSDLDLFLIDGSNCNIDECYGSSINDGLLSEYITVEVPAGVHYIVVETKANPFGASTFTLEIEQFDGKCYDAEQITCGSIINGDTQMGSIFMDEICSESNYTGRESIYEIEIDQASTIVASLTNMDVNLDLILLDSLCQDTQCISVSNNENGIDEEIVIGVQPGTYYLVVDGADGVEGSFTLQVDCNDYFEASYEDNDAYIDLDWSIDKKLCVPQDTGVIVRLLTSPPSEILYEAEYNTAALTPDIITGTYRHYVGTDHTRSYKLRVYNRLNNKILCDELQVGKTLPFQEPEILTISDSEYPDSIKVTWRNHSALSDQILIYRDGTLISTLNDGYTEDSLVVSFLDVHDINNTLSIQQDSSYTYNIETYSSQLMQSYPAVDTVGSTFAIGFTATDLDFEDRVSLQWNDISNFCTGIKLERNGILLHLLSPNETYFDDLNPIFGVTTEYSLTLMDGPNEIMEVFDQGEVAPHGVISGKVTTLQGDYPIDGATVVLSKDTIIDGEAVIITVQITTTDFKGLYSFTDVVYGLSQDFIVTANKTGSSFLPEEIIANLNQAQFDITDINFQDELPITVIDVDDLVDNFAAYPMHDEDIMSLDWTYTYDATDTLFFNLYRNGNLIFSDTDVDGAINNFEDFGGVPDSSYVYILQVTNDEGVEKLSQEIEVIVTYPSVTPISDWSFTIGEDGSIDQEKDPNIYFDWSASNHPSQNFEGFRIYRDDIAIAEVDNELDAYRYLSIPGSTSDYDIVAYRVVNGTVYESETYPDPALEITSNDIFIPEFSIDGRIITFDLSAISFESEFWNTAYYDGIAIERKLQSENDSTYLQIGEFTRQYLQSTSAVGDGAATAYFFDTYSIGNTDYDYRLSSYIEVEGVTYHNGYVVSNTPPPINGPSGLSAIEEEGKVALSWTSNHTGEVGFNTQLYINYEGYEITRTPQGSGQTPEVIATLPANNEEYNDFISNPVYDVFFDLYDDIDYEYAVNAFITVEGVKHYADPITTIAGPIAGTTSQPLPFDFMASRDLPGQIKLCWDWNAALQSEFVIFRGEDLVAILPHSARSFYDYDAPEGIDVPYTIQSRFQGEFSQAIRAEGYIPTLVTITGRVTNDTTGEGLADVNMSYFSGFFPPYSTFDFENAVSTDATGFYVFNNVPSIEGLPITIKANRINIDFYEDPDNNFNQASELITLSTESSYEVNFIDYSSRSETDEFTSILAVDAVANAAEMNIKIQWSISNENYDGFRIYRGDKILGEVMPGEGFSFVDTTGFPGILFPYGVQAYRGPASDREYSEIVGAQATFPRVEPVINLTATPFAAMNVMKIAWSHPLDNHDLYAVSRNGEFLKSIPAGDPMVWTDSTGVPGNTYQYEVIAVKGNFVSDPVAISAKYKGIGEVTQLIATIDTVGSTACLGVNNTTNHIELYWRYEPGAAQGFEIYRDNELIADIDSTVLRFGNLPLVTGDTLMSGDLVSYQDYTGVPGSMHEYHILAYVIRNGERYTSGIEELFLSAEQIFPDIAQVNNLSIDQNNILGSIQITFDYDPYIVKGFEILRDGIVMDTIFESNMGSYEYQDFTGQPGMEYSYVVRVYDRINGDNYYSGSGCEKLVSFPIVPVPQNFMATQGTFENHIEVQWDFDTQAFVDSFHLENLTLGQKVSFAVGRRKYIDLVNDNTNSNYTYRIRASREVDGTDIYSDWSVETTGWSGKQITGNEDEEIDGSCLGNYNGFAVDMDGEWGVSGAPVGAESVNIYRQIDGGWSLFQTLPSIGSGLDVDFGFSVAISGDHIIVGVPKEDRVFIYEFDGTQWGNPQSITGQADTRFGHSVDIDNEQCIISAPYRRLHAFSEQNGQIKIYDKVDGLWTESFSHITSNTERLGYGVAISGDLAAITYRNISGGVERVAVFVKTNGVWAIHSYPETLNYTAFNGLHEDNIDLKDGKLIVGDRRFDNFKGKIYTADLTVNGLSNVQNYTPSGIASFSDFGKSVAVTNIASPDDEATYYMVGAPYYDAPGYSDLGRSYLFTDLSGSFQEVEVFDNSELPEDGPLSGFSVGISETAVMMGAPFNGAVNQGKVEMRNLLKAPATVNATDGVSVNLDPSRVTITWTFDGNQDLLSGFNIYRDDELLIFRDKLTTDDIGNNTLLGEWEDNTGGAGQRYVYSVRSVNNTIPFETYSTSDAGYIKANGKIQGSVVTAGNNIAVPGVTINATGIVDGEIYTYTGTTFANGEYIITDVYYDHDPAIATEYEVEASYLDHIITASPNNIATLNSLVDPTIGLVNFVDETAYVITGKVSQPMVACPIEGVKITPYIDGAPSLLSQSTTDADGNYSIVINPNQIGLNEIRLSIDNFITSGMDTLYYDFVPDGDTVFTDFVNFPFVTEINFEDQLTYPIEIKVKNTCDDPISIAQWNVRIRTLDGCFDEIYQTNSTGNLVADLLPLNYTMSVVGATVQNATNQLATDYFANFPVQLNLQDLHIDSIETMTMEEIADESKVNFTYHVAPDISLTGFTDFICTSDVAVLQQGELYTLNIDIAEQFGSKYCAVQEGKVSISNPASNQGGKTILLYDPLFEEFPAYTFSAGDPNQISPHFYSVVVDYLSDDDVFLGRFTQLVFVEGSVALPGAGILVDPASGNDAVPLPMMVLRDPPGDGSSSYISGGQSIQYESQYTKSFGGGVEVSFNTSVGLGPVNADIGLSSTLSGSDEQVNTYSNTLTLSQTISTSSDESQIGVNADVVVGQGIVMSYGIVNTYQVGDCDKILLGTEYSISPDAAATTFNYTVGQIKDVIQGYQNDSIKIYEGKLKLFERGIELSREKSLIKVSTYIDNWKQILNFHSKETLPYYNLCTSLPPINYDAEPGNNPVGNIELWKAAVCAELGTGLNETFELNEEIVWNDAVMDLYNAASISIRNIARGTNEDNQWNYNENTQGILTQAEANGDFASYGKPVENITAGGGLTIEKSIQNVSSSTRTNTSTFYVGAEISSVFSVGEESEIVVGGFAGAGVGAFAGVFAGTIIQVASVDTKLGIKGTFEYTKSNSGTKAFENQVETGFTLSDDDPIDAFSVTAIQGISQSQTPYFEFFGGFTSCPAEEGAIFIDKPALAIEIGGGTTDNILLQNVDPDEAALIQMVAANLTPLASQPARDLTISLDPSTNVNGAVLTMNGTSLNNGNLDLVGVEANTPLNLSLTVERGPLFYEYDNLKISIEPTCGGGPVETVYVSVRYTSPCSPVTLVQPEEGWLINDNVTRLEVAMQDYDPDNEVLKNAVLEYRKLGTAAAAGVNVWNIVNSRQLLKYNEVSADSLAAYNAGISATILNPKYYFNWAIPDDFIDGEYEIRIRMACDFSNTYSNTVKGTLARREIGLYGSPEPADQVWTDGDEISFAFNLELDCNIIQGDPDFIDENITIIDDETGLPVTFTTSCFNNKLKFVLDNPVLYDGKFLTMTVDQIPSTTGNISSPHEWNFRVITQKVYWANGDTIHLRMYEDEIAQITADLINTEGVPISNILSLQADDTSMGSWIQISDPTIQPFDLSPEGRTITFEINSSVGLGNYFETINVEGVDAFGNTPQLHIKLEVLTRPPYWTIDPGAYSESMAIVANWKFDTETLDEISNDTIDIISVWAGSEIRGVANVEITDGFAYAYITVYGSPDDGDDTNLEFRIWDADPGTEYDGHLMSMDTIFFQADIQQGTVGSPRILNVNKENDLARYIPLNGNGHWTGFSLYTDTDDMSVQHKLRSLKYEMEGDIILTGDQFAQYNDSIGWYSFGNQALIDLNTSDGYMIYLQGADDTLRVSGAITTAANIDLHNGWNWMGFPFNTNENVNLSFTYPAANGLDKLKKDTPLPGESNQNAQYNPSNQSWQGNLPTMEPNNLYKLYISNPNPTELDWIPEGENANDAQQTSSELGQLADPNDEETWSQPKFNSDAVMPLVAQVLSGGIIANHPDDRVAIFENDTIRGYASPIYLSEFDTYEFSILVEEGEGIYDIKYYDAATDIILTSTNSLIYRPSGDGTFDLPYEIIFDDGSCPNQLILGPSETLFDINKTYEAGQIIRVRGTYSIPTGIEIILDAPKVIFDGEITPQSGSSLIIKPDGCN